MVGRYHWWRSIHILRLTENGWTQTFLIDQPERGMGYHLVDVHLMNGDLIQKVKVYNCEDMELPDRYKKITENDIAKVANLGFFQSLLQ